MVSSPLSGVYVRRLMRIERKTSGWDDLDSAKDKGYNY